MPRARSLAILLTAALLAVASAPPAIAQSGSGAGDQQYQDPFGTSKGSSGSKTKTTSSSAPSKKGKKNGLSQTPNLGASGTAGTTTSATTPSSSSSASAGASELPRTGADVGRIALVGLVLVLFGIGLRLRTADERS